MSEARLSLGFWRCSVRSRPCAATVRFGVNSYFVFGLHDACWPNLGAARQGNRVAFEERLALSPKESVAVVAEG